MSETRRALRAWEAHLEEAVGVDDAAVIVDEFDHHVSEDYLDRALERLSRELTEQTRTQSQQLTEQLTGALTAAWRRDLLLVTCAQFFALAAAVAALVELG